MQQTGNSSDRQRKIYRVTLMGSLVNVVLLIFKFVAGILGHSTALIADAVHSLSDFLTDIVVHDHPHGAYRRLPRHDVRLRHRPDRL